jgi:hypothetical protein
MEWVDKKEDLMKQLHPHEYGRETNKRKAFKLRGLGTADLFVFHPRD